MNKPTITSTIVAGLLSLNGFSTATAQDSDEKKWSVGLLGLANRTAFNAFDADGREAEDVLYNAFPYVTYNGDRFFVDGMTIGYRLIKPHEDASLQFGLDAIVAARNVMIPGRTKITADAGFTAYVGGDYGTLSVSGLHDITDTFNGGEVSAQYSYTFNSGKFSFTPSVGAAWQSKKTANHMWGVSERQNQRMVNRGKNILPVFELDDSVINYSAEGVVTYAATNSWTLIGYGGVTLLDKDIRENPGITRKYDATLGLGATFSF